MMASDRGGVSTDTPLPAGTDTRTRIVDAGIRCVARAGVHGASMSAIATEAAVSKALLHYHFADRARLLAEMVATLGQRLVARERSALAHGPDTRTIDLLWDWLDVELRKGELRALSELQMVPSPLVRLASERAATDRRVAAASIVRSLFARLGLTPRIDVELIGDTTIAFIDGLALDRTSARDARVSFDVFWLAILSLAD